MLRNPPERNAQKRYHQAKINMKIIIYISFFLPLNSCKAQEKEGVLINPTLMPNMEYKTSVHTENNTIIEYVGNNAIIENLKSKGIEYPITSNSKNLIVSTMRTGIMNNNQEFIIKSTYDKVETELTGSITKLKEKNSSIEKLQGAQAYGKVLKDLKIEIDSIIGLKDESFRTTIEQGMKTILNQIDYPKEHIKKGESFTINTPVKFPAGNGVMMDMILTNKYFLDSISNVIAYFSIEQNIKIETSIEQTDLIVEGKGSGLIQYDIKIQSNKLYYTEFLMNSEVEVSGVKVKTTALTKSTTTTEIIKPDNNK